MRRNVRGVQEERWFHRDGCRRWLTLSRDTATNAVLSEGVQTPAP
jgi:heterotetrameric sarcosine oxidase delta subunit